MPRTKQDWENLLKVFELPHIARSKSGEILVVEITRGRAELESIIPGWNQINWGTINPGVLPKGNHYHKEKNEITIVGHGNLRVHLVDIQTKERYSRIIPENHSILFPAGFAHAVENAETIGNSVMYIYFLSGRQYDSTLTAEQNDVFKYPVK